MEHVMCDIKCRRFLIDFSVHHHRGKRKEGQRCRGCTTDISLLVFKKENVGGNGSKSIINTLFLAFVLNTEWVLVHIVADLYRQ